MVSLGSFQADSRSSEVTRPRLHRIWCSAHAHQGRSWSRRAFPTLKERVLTVSLGYTLFRATKTCTTRLSVTHALLGFTKTRASLPSATYARQAFSRTTGKRAARHAPRARISGIPKPQTAPCAPQGTSNRRRGSWLASTVMIWGISSKSLSARQSANHVRKIINDTSECSAGRTEVRASARKVRYSGANRP